MRHGPVSVAHARREASTRPRTEARNDGSRNAKCAPKGRFSRPRSLAPLEASRRVLRGVSWGVARGACLIVGHRLRLVLHHDAHARPSLVSGLLTQRLRPTSTHFPSRPPALHSSKHPRQLAPASPRRTCMTQLLELVLGRSEHLAQKLQRVGFELDKLQADVEPGRGAVRQPLDPHDFGRVGDGRHVHKKELHLQ